MTPDKTFPIEIGTYNKLCEDRHDLRVALKRLLNAYEADYECMPDVPVRISYETNTCSLKLAHDVLERTESYE